MAKSVGHLAKLTFLAVLLAVVPGRAQQPAPAPADDAAQAPAQAGQQLDLEEAVAHDVLEPLQAGMESRNLKQVLSVFDPQSSQNFPQLEDRMKALLEAYNVVQFRYKILQASSENAHASMTCEVDLDGTPVDDGKVPVRRSTQMRLQLTQTPKGWRISGYSPSDFFNQ